MPFPWKPKTKKLLRGIESLKGQNVDEIRWKLEVLRSEYERRELEAEQKVEIQLTEALRKEGIHGTAVSPVSKRAGNGKRGQDPLLRAFREGRSV